jgi:hypothetical protein
MIKGEIEVKVLYLNAGSFCTKFLNQRSYCWPYKYDQRLQVVAVAESADANKCSLKSFEFGSGYG